jgi:hypothetical protein
MGDVGKPGSARGLVLPCPSDRDDWAAASAGRADGKPVSALAMAAANNVRFFPNEPPNCRLAAPAPDPLRFTSTQKEQRQNESPDQVLPNVAPLYRAKFLALKGHGGRAVERRGITCA